jgi:hypothetical protein
MPTSASAWDATSPLRLNPAACAGGYCPSSCHALHSMFHSQLKSVLILPVRVHPRSIPFLACLLTARFIRSMSAHLPQSGCPQRSSRSLRRLTIMSPKTCFRDIIRSDINPVPRQNLTSTTAIASRVASMSSVTATQRKLLGSWDYVAKKRVSRQNSGRQTPSRRNYPSLRIGASIRDGSRPRGSRRGCFPSEP